MVRAITTDATITNTTQILNARGANVVLLVNEDEPTALKEACPWLPWSVVEDLNALPYHEWVAFLTIRKPDVDPLSLIHI